MKSFLAIAAIAAVTFAAEDAEMAERDFEINDEERRSDYEWLVEDFYEEFEQALEDLVRMADRNPAELAEEGFEEAQREIEREMEKAMEDLECAMADLPGGDGTCPKREREAAA